MAADSQISYILHPRLHSRDQQDMQCSVHVWALRPFKESAQLEGDTTSLWIQEDTAGADPATVALLERDGYTRDACFYNDVDDIASVAQAQAVFRLQDVDAFQCQDHRSVVEHNLENSRQIAPLAIEWQVEMDVTKNTRP